ncbi:hypothetical protein [Aurantiacibacter hainanensis]|uniref:hypothetical protein n=1 Tax=Aurantiacibacter hainanensis TaxID=3076114 RepID=UPI0030C7082F
MAIMERPATPWHLWVIGILALLWNGFGAYDYLMTQTRNEAYMSAFTPEQLEYFYSFPLWMEVFWALGVWSAFLGAILLVLRSQYAFLALALGLLGLVGSSIYQFTNPAPAGVLDGTGLIMTVVIWISQILLAVYAYVMMRRGVLR